MRRATTCTRRRTSPRWPPAHHLVDDDRWPWLDTVSSWIIEQTSAAVPGIITCSALRRRYRDVMRGPNVVFVHLDGARDDVAQRLSARVEHFMPATLLDSQCHALERPEPDENDVTVRINGSPTQIVDDIITRLGLEPAR